MFSISTTEIPDTLTTDNQASFYAGCFAAFAVRCIKLIFKWIKSLAS